MTNDHMFPYVNTSTEAGQWVPVEQYILWPCGCGNCTVTLEIANKYIVLYDDDRDAGALGARRSFAMPPSWQLMRRVEPTEPPVELRSAHLWHLIDQFAAMPPEVDDEGNECDSNTPNFVVLAMLRDLRALVERYQPNDKVKETA